MNDYRARRYLFFVLGASDIGFLLLLTLLINRDVGNSTLQIPIQLPAVQSEDSSGSSQINPNKIVFTSDRMLHCKSNSFNRQIELSKIKGRSDIIQKTVKDYLNSLKRDFGENNVFVDLYADKDTPYGDLAQALYVISHSRVSVQLIFDKHSLTGE